ncbi:hypothetical protein GCM10027615_28920 [Plantactinospora veratri]
MQGGVDPTEEFLADARVAEREDAQDDEDEPGGGVPSTERGTGDRHDRRRPHHGWHGDLSGMAHPPVQQRLGQYQPDHQRRYGPDPSNVAPV